MLQLFCDKNIMFVREKKSAAKTRYMTNHSGIAKFKILKGLKR